MPNCFRSHHLGSLAVTALFSAAVIVAPAQGQIQANEAATHPFPWAYARLEAPLPTTDRRRFGVDPVTSSFFGWSVDGIADFVVIFLVV